MDFFMKYISLLANDLQPEVTRQNPVSVVLVGVLSRPRARANFETGGFRGPRLP